MHLYIDRYVDAEIVFGQCKNSIGNYAGRCCSEKILDKIGLSGKAEHLPSIIFGRFDLISFGDVHGWSEVGIFRGIGPVIDTSTPSERVCGGWNEGRRERDKIVIMLHGMNRRLLLLVPGRVAWID